ncbi:MAG: SPOCS domain-containing protein [Butyrivibrio sp.]
METDKKVIHMSRTKGKEEAMITVDDDFILSDGKPDIRNKIKEHGEVTIDKVRAMEGRIGIAGKLKYRLLYSTGNGCNSMEGEIPFEEIISMEEVTPQDIIKCVHFLEDISIHVIHSRKISVKALIRINVTADTLYDREAVCKIEMDNLQSRQRNLNVMKLLSSQKDIYRIRETVNLPSSNDSAGKILWYELDPESVEFRLRDGELGIKGELAVFCIYSSEQMEESVNFHSEHIPFSGKIALNDSAEDAYPDINYSISEKSMVLRPDGNGEMRTLDIEVIMDMDIKAYGEDNCDILADAYSPTRELVLTKEKIQCQSMVMKNNLQCRVDGRFKLNAADVMQILNAVGTVYIEEIISKPEEIELEGAVTVDVLYLRADGEEPVGFGRYKLPFTQSIDGLEYGENYIYNCKTEGLRINATLVNGEVDIKCVLGIDLMITNPSEETVISEVTDKEPDYNRIKNLPGITGYITKAEDSLWDIAKKYGTTVSKIMETNNLTTEDIRPGMKILVVKSC